MNKPTQTPSLSYFIICVFKIMVALFCVSALLAVIGLCLFVGFGALAIRMGG